MKPLLILIALITLSGKLRSQTHSIEIPCIENLNPDDKYPERSILATYLTSFDILISLNGYSTWGPDEHIKVLAHHKSGWYKIEINTDHKSFGTFDAVCYLMFKIKDSIGNIIWIELNENHLFDMQDERTMKMPCLHKPDTLIRNGKAEIVQEFMMLADGPEYEFQILTENKYKKLYFYAPAEFYNYCQEPIERKWVLNCINAFEKYLGK